MLFFFMCIPALAESSCRKIVFLTDCVRLHRPCGQFGPDDSLRLVGMTRDESKIFVGDFEAVDKGYEMCNCSDVILSAKRGSKHCPESVTLKEDEGLLVMFVGIVVLPGLLCSLRCMAKSKEERARYATALYWGYDFLAGIWSLVVSTASAEISTDPFSPFYWSGKFIWATVFETILFDMPMYLVKAMCPSAFMWCLVPLGTIWGALAIRFAYAAETVIMLGHHVLLLGLIQWLIDIVKGVGWRLLKRKLCGSGDEDSSVAPGYQAFQQEMMHPLPEQD